MSTLPVSAHLPKTLWRNRFLFVQLCARDIAERYRGSMGGIFWSLVTPLVMLGIYTFVFSVIFKARWGDRAVSRLDYALLLFAGLLTFNIFSECATRAPLMIASKPNFVKKVVFPLELVPLVALGNSLFHFAASFAILMAFCIFAYGSVPWTIVFVPVVLLPLLLLTLAVSWLLSSLGVFVHDVRHIVPLITSALMFLTPIFYPVTSVPESVRPFIWLNPLAIPIESMRMVSILGEFPDWPKLAASIGVNGLLAVVCFLWFQRARRYFADVL